MKNTTLLTLLAVFCLSLFAGSCRMANNLVVQKRHYRDGWYIAMRDRAPQAAPVAAATVTPIAATSVATLPEKTVAENPASPSASDVATTHKTPAKKHRTEKFTSPLVAADHFAQLSTARAAIKHPVATTPHSDVAVVLLIIIAIFIPPLAILLFEGLTGRFLLDLIIWLLAIGVYFVYPIGGLLALFAILYAIIVVLGEPRV